MNSDGDFLFVPPGQYRIGISPVEVEEWKASTPGVAKYCSSSTGFPVPLEVAFPVTTIEIQGFYIGPLHKEPVTFQEAKVLAESQGGRLPGEVEWEIAERYLPQPISEHGYGEWCLDYFQGRRTRDELLATPILLDCPKLQIGSPPGRRVVRGANFPVYHPAMRFHGGPNNHPIGSTGYRVLKPLDGNELKGLSASR